MLRLAASTATLSRKLNENSLNKRLLPDINDLRIVTLSGMTNADWNFNLAKLISEWQFITKVSLLFFLHRNFR